MLHNLIFKHDLFTKDHDYIQYDLLKRKTSSVPIIYFPISTLCTNMTK